VSLLHGVVGGSLFLGGLPALILKFLTVEAHDFRKSKLSC
jgi:hypothetical protein